MSTYTTSGLYIELIGTGEQTGIWGASTNNNFQYVFEEAIIGRANVAFADANVTLTPVAATTNQTFRNVYLNCTGTNTVTRSLIVPNIYKNYIVENNLSSATSILVTTAAGTGITVPNGYKCAVYVDSTNVVQASNYFPVAYAGSLTLTSALLTTSGGTGLNTFTAGDLMYYASGTAMTKLGIGTNGYVLTSNGTSPVWSAQSTLSASNLLGGNTGSLPYQNNTNSTTFLSIGSAGQVLVVNAGVSAPEWSNSLSLSGSITAGTSLTATAGNITATAGNIVATAGNINATAGSVNAALDSVFSSTGALTISKGTTAQRPSPVSAMLRFNTTTVSFEGYNGTSWGGIGGAAADNCINTNYTTISSNYTFPAGYNGSSVGPITIAAGGSVTVPSGQTWVVF
jgi:prepilin-type processing-associated H-X9-DG protein